MCPSNGLLHNIFYIIFCSFLLRLTSSGSFVHHICRPFFFYPSSLFSTDKYNGKLKTFSFYQQTKWCSFLLMLLLRLLFVIYYFFYLILFYFCYGKIKFSVCSALSRYTFLFPLEFPFGFATENEKQREEVFLPFFFLL